MLLSKQRLITRKADYIYFHNDKTSERNLYIDITDYFMYHWIPQDLASKLFLLKIW